jgi:WD40 repeat protein
MKSNLGWLLMSSCIFASAWLQGCGGGGSSSPASTPPVTYPDPLAVLLTDGYVIVVDNDLSTQEVYWAHSSGDTAVVKRADALYSLGTRTDKFDLKSRTPDLSISAPIDAMSAGLNLPAGSGRMTGIAAGSSADTLYVAYQTAAGARSVVEQYVSGQNIGTTKDTLSNLHLWGLRSVDNFVYGACGNTSTDLCIINKTTKALQRLPFYPNNYTPSFQNGTGYSSAYASTFVRRFALSAGVMSETAGINLFAGTPDAVGNTVYASTFTPDGNTLVATASESGYMTLLDLTTGQTTATVKLDTKYPQDVVAVGDYIFVIGMDRSVTSGNLYDAIKKLEVWKRSPTLQLVSSKVVKNTCPVASIYYTADRTPRCSV